MSAANHRTQFIWMALLCALGFAVAGCAAEQGASKPAGGAGPSRGRSESGSAQSAPPGSEPVVREPQRSTAAVTPLGDRIEIRQSWVQVRAKPDQEAAAIALAFGNDTYPVVEKQGDWVRVKLEGNREGWIPLSATGSR